MTSNFTKNKKVFYLVGLSCAPIFFICLPEIFLFKYFNNINIENTELNVFLFSMLYCLLFICFLMNVYLSRGNSIKWTLKFLQYAGIILIGTIFFQIYSTLAPYQIFRLSSWIEVSDASVSLYKNKLNFLPFFVPFALIIFLIKLIKMEQFDETKNSDKTTGNFGSAAWANENYLQKIDAFNPNNKHFIGSLNDRDLYFELQNKLTISPPGGGKTSASSIPILLSYNGPVFVFDIKGELWAVSARYRSEVLKRNIVVIDPFNVTSKKEFTQNKPENLLKTFTFNPFDWIPEDSNERDRMINTFAASFVINEGGTITHFDENAKILIRGYIDYIMTLNKEERNLTTLFDLMSESKEEAEITFNQMSQLSGRAGAAANQIMRVGADERGSILSTSYRQIDWMGDRNIQKTLSESNFNLEDFLKGNMDIFIVLPEDQVAEHNRLVRMMLSLLMSMLVKASPQELPKRKMLFLLEELAQLGYTPDVEKCIEILRARGVVVWTVFQTLSQIEMFEKPDLFKGATIKQIFTNDDTKTMEWIQTLGGKKTVLTKTLSTNKGDSRKQFQIFGQTISSGDGESVHETSADLIQLNEIRELKSNEQFIFVHGVKPIRCKKIRYFENPGFYDRYDTNPLEARY